MLNFLVRAMKQKTVAGKPAAFQRMSAATSQVLERLEPRRMLASVAIDLNDTAQTIKGIGGTYSKAAFRDDGQDRVGEENLKLLDPRYVRVAIPVDNWEPVNDNSDPNSANASGFVDTGFITENFQMIKKMDDDGRVITASWYNLPDWFVSNPTRQSGRLVKAGFLPEVAETMVQFVKRAKEVYGANIDYLSFNEVDGGYDVKLTAAENADLIELTGKRLAAEGYGHIKFIVGETYRVKDSAPYMKAILDDAGAKPYLGPISYHSWWSEEIPQSEWQKMVDLADQYDKELWSGEMNYYALAENWRFPTWTNAMRLATITAKTLTWGGAEVAMYWQYQDDFPLMSSDTTNKYPSWHVLKSFVDNFKGGSQIVESQSNDSEVFTIAGRDTARNRFATIAINNASTEKSVTWTGLPNKPLTLIRNANGQKSNNIGTYTPVNGTLTLTVPALTVNTLQGELGTVDPTPPPPPPPPPTNTLPDGWFAKDIGTVGLAGSTAYNGAPNQDWTIKGAGPGVAGAGDDFQFAYRKLVGDAQIVVRLNNIQGTTNPAAQAGIMIRDTTSAGSRQASLFVTPSAGLQVTTRKSNGAGTGTATLQGGTLPRWLKVTRQGQLMTFYTSSDGASWSQAASTTIDMGADALIGMAVSSRDTTKLNTSTFDNVDVTAVDTVPPPPPPPPPTNTQQPFGGTAPVLSSTQHAFVQAENFDSGGQGVAYNDTTSNNIGGAYRNEAVDIKLIAGKTNQFRISDSKPGEWLEYTVNVAEAGQYWLMLAAGNRDAGSTMHAEVNGVNITGAISVPDTDSFDTFKSAGAQVNLAAGQQVVRVQFDTVGASGYGAALDWVWIGK